MTRTRVLCIDDAPDMRELMLRLIAREPDLEGVGALESADDLVSQVQRTSADIVLLDLSMPGADPLEAIRDLRSSGSACRALVVSGRDDPETIDRAKAAGAAGFISKDAGPAKIIAELRKVASMPHGG